MRSVTSIRTTSPFTRSVAAVNCRVCPSRSTSVFVERNERITGRPAAVGRDGAVHVLVDRRILDRHVHLEPAVVRRPGEAVDVGADVLVVHQHGPCWRRTGALPTTGTRAPMRMLDIAAVVGVHRQRVGQAADALLALISVDHHLHVQRHQRAERVALGCVGLSAPEQERAWAVRLRAPGLPVPGVRQHRTQDSDRQPPWARRPHWRSPASTGVHLDRPLGAEQRHLQGGHLERSVLPVRGRQQVRRDSLLGAGHQQAHRAGVFARDQRRRQRIDRVLWPAHQTCRPARRRMRRTALRLPAGAGPSVRGSMRPALLTSVDPAAAEARRPAGSSSTRGQCSRPGSPRRPPPRPSATASVVKGQALRPRACAHAPGSRTRARRRARSPARGRVRWSVIAAPPSTAGARGTAATSRCLRECAAGRRPPSCRALRCWPG